MWAKQKGFTIVELLIVIVVIAILAAIVIVAYNGVQNRANDSAIQSDLRSLGQKIRQMKITSTNDRLPHVAADISAQGAKASYSAYGNHYTPSGSSGYNLLYCFTDVTTDNFGLVAASKSGKYYRYKDGSVSQGVGPLVSWTTTCANNDLPQGGFWFYSNGGWQI